MEMRAIQALCRLSLGEAHLLAGRLEEAHALAERALALAHEHQERGHQAYALRLLGEIAARREPPESEQAEAHYRQALALAEELGMRPLQAHCHLGLGTLYAKIGPAGTGPRRAVHRHRAVPRHGHDLLAAPGGGGTGAGGGAVMDFYEVLARVIELLQRRGPRSPIGRSSGSLVLDDDYLEDLKVELIEVKQLAVDQEGTCWSGREQAAPLQEPSTSSLSIPPTASNPRGSSSPSRTPAEPHVPDAERRQLTVLFCDLVDSTVLASQLDPEEWREVVRAYQDTCAKVIARYEGHIAQYLGDGLLVYFGYPQAHEDDAQRAVRAGLGMVEAMAQLNTRLEQERGVQLAVRLGIHTGLVVVGEMGGGTRPGTVGAGRDPQPRRPPARARGAQYPGDQRRDLSAARRLLCLPVARHAAPERRRPAAGGLSGVV